MQSYVHPRVESAAMEFQLPFSTIAMAAMFTFLFLYYFSKIAKSSERKRTAPEAAGAWPVIGHLHLLGGPELPHKTLGAMADKYGPVFLIKLGVQRVLMLSNWEMAKECFTTNDKVFANRPKSIAVEVLGYNYAMFGFGPYGSYWRQVRKIVTTGLLSNRRLEIVKHVWISEVKASIRELYELWINKRSDSNMVLVEMKDWFGDLSLNMVLRMLSGGRDSSSKEERMRCHKLVRDFFEFMGTFLVSDALPLLRWFDFGGYEKAMRKTAKDLDNLLESWLQQHKSKRSSEQADGNQDFMDVMLSKLDDMATDEDLKGFDADTINKATCLTILAGGTDTVTVSLIWALSLLLNKPQVLKTAREELDLRVGRERQVEERDMKNLAYLNAIVKETLRLYPAGPLTAPHESTEDCLVGGYHIPAGTRLLANLWKIHRDPSIWSDPDEFRPERFLTTHKDVDVKGQHFELIPFGSGRRICPGLSFGLQFMQFTLASLIQGFEFATMSDEPVDMTESIGLTNLKATPLEVLVAPRLSSDLYE